MKKTLILLIIIGILAAGIGYYFFDYKSDLRIKKQTQEMALKAKEMLTPTYTICQNNFCVGFENGGLNVNKNLAGCLDVATTTFCGSYYITRNK